MTAPVAAWTARFGLALWVVHGPAAQSAPRGFPYKHLQAFEAEAKFTPQTRRERLHAYGRRFANDMAYNGVRCTLTYASSILRHEDDRYFASEQRGGWPRVRHALASVFTAHKSDGGIRDIQRWWGSRGQA